MMPVDDYEGMPRRNSIQLSLGNERRSILAAERTLNG